MTQLTPSQEDPFVHGMLETLEMHAPSPGFADRVMSQVWQPAPTWVQRAANVRQKLFNRKRVWVWAGALATTSAVSMVAAIAAALTYRVQLATFWSLTWTMALEAWRFAVVTSASFTALSLRWLEPVLNSRSTVATFAAASTLLVALSAFGLQRTIRQYRTERVLLHAGK